MLSTVPNSNNRLACLALIALVIAGSPLHAAEHTRPSLDAQLAAMKKLYPFAGTWLGEGWFTLRGERTDGTHLLHLERVEAHRLGGAGTEATAEPAAAAAADAAAPATACSSSATAPTASTPT